MIRKFLQTNLQSLPFSRSSHDYLLTREPVTIYPKLYLAPNRKANLTSTISVAIYNTQVQTLTFNLLQEKKIMFLKSCVLIYS